MKPTDARTVLLGCNGVPEFEYVKHSWQERGKVTRIQTHRLYPTILVHPEDFEHMWILAVDGAGMDVIGVDLPSQPEPARGAFALETGTGITTQPRN